MTQSTRRTALTGLLLLLVTASGCGVALPTQPNTNDTTLRPEASARVGQLDAGAIPSMEMNDNPGGAGGITPTPVVVGDPEIYIPTPGLPHTGSLWGHSHKKPKN